MVGNKNQVARFFDRKNTGKSVTIVKTAEGMSGNWVSMQMTVNAGEETLKSTSFDGNRESEIRIVNKLIVRVDAKQNGKESHLVVRPGSRNRFVDANRLLAQKYKPDNDDEDGQWLPEFVVLGYSSRDPTPFVSLFWIANMNPLFIRTFSPGDIIPRGNSGEGGAKPKSDFEDAVEVEEFVFDDFRNKVKLKELLKCFDNIPDAGAKYAITLHADLPDNNDPNKLVENFSPGHTFLSFTKTNGSSSVTQVFGFYPFSGPLTVLNLEVPSLIMDDGGHEFNSSIAIANVDASHFKAAEKLAGEYADDKDYDLNDFNCTNFALDVFNKARPGNDQIHVPDWRGSLTNLNYGSTPNGLYKVLRRLKNENGKEANNITMGNFLAIPSKGPCK
ncbi:MAG: hypothetical protein ABI151_00705 [Chitinophagaceae bacterium]